MNNNIFDVNYTIGKNTIVDKGTITKIEIDGVEYTYNSAGNVRLNYE